jgi:phosphopantetheinyl transferase (holo-ACP synthase)
MIGSDVIDLRDAESRPESFRPRFDERVFLPEERRTIARDPNPLARRWAHWGAKEAAFKLVKQFDSGFVFSPGRWVVHFEAEPAVSDRRANRVRRGAIEIPASSERAARLIDLQSDETSDRVHVVAIPMGSDWSAVDVTVEAIAQTSADRSVAVRELAAGEISRRLGVARARVTIGKRDRIPIVLLDGRPTSLSLSLSHHGVWIASAIAPTVDPLGELASSSDSKEAGLRVARADGSR